MTRAPGDGTRARLCSGVVLAALALTLLAPSTAAAGDPQADHQADHQGALELQPPPVPRMDLAVPQLAALQPAPSYLFAPTLLAKRASDRSFDTSHGERDPRVRERPRTHRFRLAIASHWVRLTQAVNPNTGMSKRFHYAPMYLDLAYQAQFLKYVMVRLAVGVGGNVANSRNAMPVSVFPQVYVGYQGKIAGVAFGYGFDWTIPPTFHAVANESFAIEQPVITRNHVVMGELSVTSRIDKVALTFAFAVGGIQSDLTHFSTYNRKWRPYIGFSFGGFFDGSKRREKKALKQAEAQGL